MTADLSVLAALRRAARIAPTLARGLGLTLALALIGTAGHVVVPILIQQVLDHEVLAPGQIDLRRAVGMTALAAAAVTIAMLATRTALVRLVQAAAHGLTELRIAAFRHLHTLSVLRLQTERRGVLVSRVTSDVESLNEFLSWGGVGMIVGSAQILITLAVMLLYDWRIAALVVAGAAGYALMLVAFQRILRRAYDRVRVRVGESLAATGEAISGLPTIRAYGAEERTQRRTDDALDAQFRVEFRAAMLGAVMFSSAEVFAAAVTACVIAAGVLLGGGVTAGTLVAFLFLVALFIEPLQTVVETLNQAQTAAAGLRRILGVLESETDVADPLDGADLPPGALGVVLGSVHFRYPGADVDALRGISVEIPAGSRIAVVGETGSGKTTFAKLLVRLMDPGEGWILVGGLPLDRLRFRSLRDRVAFVPQEGFLFDGTVADNVRYGRIDASDDDILRAFDELDLDGWLDSLPGGLHARVGEQGGRLSSGERQLVALVRAWIADPDLLVLDEATSAVDPALEVRLRRAIERLTAGRTSVTVAHRLSTAEAADEVLVFDGGELVERGSHAELVAAGSVYAALHADWSISTAATG